MYLLIWDINTIQYNTIQYNTIQYNTIQFNTLPSWFQALSDWMTARLFTIWSKASYKESLAWLLLPLFFTIDNFHIATMVSGFFWLTYKALHHLVVWELCTPCPGRCHLCALLMHTLWGQNLAPSSTNQFRHSFQLTASLPPILCWAAAASIYNGNEQLK